MQFLFDKPPTLKFSELFFNQLRPQSQLEIETGYDLARLQIWCERTKRQSEK